MQRASEARTMRPHYREYAIQINELADGERDIGLRNKLRTIANQYQALADYLYPQP